MSTGLSHFTGKKMEDLSYLINQITDNGRRVVEIKSTFNQFAHTRVQNITVNSSAS